jgi:hypothetical protein
VLTHATIPEIAAAEKINESYVGRVLRLTLLAPDIVEAILNGRQPAGLQLDRLLRRFPVGWRKQWAGPRLCRGIFTCAEHDRQLGGESPLSSLMVAKD